MVETRAPHQLTVTALFDELTLVEDEDGIGLPNRGEPMRNDENSPPLADAAEIVLNDPLGLVVERAGGFVENQNARVCHQRTCNCDPLPLTPGEGGAPFTHRSIVGLRELQNEIMGPRQLGHLHDLAHGCPR